MTNVETKPPEQASIPELINRLTEQTSRLVRDEMALAQQEFRIAAKRTGIGAGLFSTAGLLAYTGLLAVVAAAIAALSLALPVWAAAAIVAAVLFAAAGIAGVLGKKQVEQAPAAAHEVTASVSEDVHAVKEARHGRT
ncbi:phage holin family protein [Mycolicibacterium frederiksbergense]|uniref:phage holin family protein n=1 Tax=Mycolicibacterium frederiksbergense TaxID=117567 RepID=UPI00265C12EF|nr:phage holin family protein [Mycolicibacterium frederiksbergense]MBX9919885.1 phage holin family protein [Mycolicibacterium frederiksbergense]MDO0973287.1 phage holin family protein [Mycolicibacterium frederiksbergense]